MKYNVLSSGSIAATTGASVSAGSVGPMYHGCIAASDGTNTCVVTVYHGSSTSGVIMDRFSIAASTAAPQRNMLNNPVQCPNGIYIVVTGTGATAVVHYSVGA